MFRKTIPFNTIVSALVYTKHTQPVILMVCIEVSFMDSNNGKTVAKHTCILEGQTGILCWARGINVTSVLSIYNGATPWPPLPRSVVLRCVVWDFCVTFPRISIRFGTIPFLEPSPPHPKRFSRVASSSLSVSLPLGGLWNPNPPAPRSRVRTASILIPSFDYGFGIDCFGNGDFFLTGLWWRVFQESHGGFFRSHIMQVFIMLRLLGKFI